MKKIIILTIFILGIFSGCTNMSRNASSITSLNEQNDIQIKVIRTISYQNQWLKRHEGGLEIEITNNTNEVKYINWSSSSLTYDGFTSRITTGNDKVANINSIVPNTAILPNGKTKVVIIAADAISMQIYPAATYINVDPFMDKVKNVDLIISYSNNDIQNLKQAIYRVEL